MATLPYGSAKDSADSRLIVLNQWSASLARLQFGRCCGSSSWINKMVAARPFSSIQDLQDAADLIWDGCSHEDWLEAFAAHPKIGERGNTEWSREEQSGAARMPEEVQDALIHANREYEAKYGYTFIVCASGKSAEEMLAAVRQRLGNDPLGEIHNASEQQRLITHLRLGKLLNEIHNNPRS